MFDELSSKDSQLLYLFKSIRSVVSSDAHVFKESIFPVLMENNVQDYSVVISIVDELRLLTAKYCECYVPCSRTLLSERPFEQEAAEDTTDGASHAEDCYETRVGGDLGFVIRKSSMSMYVRGESVCSCVVECVVELLFKFVGIRTKQCVESLVYASEKYSCGVFDRLLDIFREKKDIELELLIVGQRLISEGRMCGDECKCTIFKGESATGRGCAVKDVRGGKQSEDVLGDNADRTEESSQALFECSPDKQKPEEAAAESARSLLPSREQSAMVSRIKEVVASFSLDDYQSSRFVLKNVMEFLSTTVDSALFLTMCVLVNQHISLFLDNVQKLRHEGYKPDLNFIFRKIACQRKMRGLVFQKMPWRSNRDIYMSWLEETGEEHYKSRCFHLFMERSEATVWIFLYLWSTGDKESLVRCIEKVAEVHAELRPLGQSKCPCREKRAKEHGEERSPGEIKQTDAFEAICNSLRSLRICTLECKLQVLLDVTSVENALKECVSYSSANFCRRFVKVIGVLRYFDGRFRKSVLSMLAGQKWRERKLLLEAFGDNRTLFTEDEIEIIGCLKSDKAFIVREMAREMLPD